VAKSDFSRARFLLGATGLAGIVLAATPAIAATKTGYLSLNNLAFSSSTNTQAYTNFLDGGIQLNGPGSGCFNTGISSLPQGAKITHIAVFYRASANRPSPTFRVVRKRASDGLSETISSGTGSNQSGGRASMQLTVNPTLATINNLTFSYAMTVCVMDVTNSFYLARVTYTYNSN
jgi:hypothetical protein